MGFNFVQLQWVLVCLGVVGYKVLSCGLISIHYSYIVVVVVIVVMVVVTVVVVVVVLLVVVVVILVTNRTHVTRFHFTLSLSLFLSF